MTDTATETKGTAIQLKVLSCVVKNSHNARLQTEHKLKKVCAKEHSVPWSVLKEHYKFLHSVKGNLLLSALIPKAETLVIHKGTP